MLTWLINLFKPKKEEKKIEYTKPVENKEIFNSSAEDEIARDIVEEIEIKNYQVVDYSEEIPLQTIKWKSEYTFEFEQEEIAGFKPLRIERVVGCYYRQENINEVINTFKKLENIRFKVVVKRDFHNEYDSNAQEVYLLYLVGDEIRKMQLGFLSKETALDLNEYEDIKASLIKIENLTYKDTHLIIFLKSEIVDRLKEKQRLLAEQRKKIESEEKLKEINDKITFELNQFAITLEKMGRTEEAIEKYKEAIKLGFDGSYPFDRLNVYYRKQKDYDSEIDNCRQAIELFERIINRVDAPDKLQKYKERLERVLELKQKEIDKEAKARAKEEKIKAKKTEDTLSKQLDDRRVCTICGVEKPIDDFEKNGKDSKGNPKYKYQCKLCRNEAKRNKK